MGLLAAGEVHSDAVARGIEYLLQTQRSDGAWDEPQYTGTGFPRVFYLRYHLYRIYFPLMALGRYNRLRQRGACSAKPCLAPREEVTSQGPRLARTSATTHCASRDFRHPWCSPAR